MAFRLPTRIWVRTGKLGNTPGDIVRTMLFNWPVVIKLLFSKHNLSFLLQLFGPLLILSLLGFRTLLIATPLFLQDLLSNFPGQQTITFFYSSTLTVFIFMATIEFWGSISFSRELPLRQARREANLKAGLFFFIIGLVFLYDLKYVPTWIKRIAVPQEKTGNKPPSFVPNTFGCEGRSSYEFLYMLSQRKDVYVLYLKENRFTSQKEQIPDDVDYMLVDFGIWGKGNGPSLHREGVDQ